MTGQICNFRKINLNGFIIDGNNFFNSLCLLELNISNPEESSHIVKDAYKNIYKNPVKWVESAQKTDCDILGLKFNISKKEQITGSVKLLKLLLPSISKPLMIRGVSDTQINAELLSALIEVLDRESIIAFADEKSYKELVPKIIKGNHVLVIRTPIDINLAKEMNILASSLGLNPDKILIDTDTGGLGYGLEYGYSLIERIRLAGLNSDEMLNMPIIAFAGEESLKVKEAVADNLGQSWGEFKQRSLMFEITAASALCAAGANIVVVNHPQTVRTLKGLL